MNHHHKHNAHSEHDHIHGRIDPSILTTRRGIWAVKWSFIGLLITALLQAVIVFLSGSVALYADTLHNFSDAATSIPLWIAFKLSQLKPNKRFSYGYGRAEDFAGVAIVLIILLTAIIVGSEVIDRFLNPRPVYHLWTVIGASVIGFFGNEFVAQLRIKVGKEIDSAALMADGYHARVDGLTSLSVLISAVGVWLGYPITDPLVGLFITLIILRIVWQASKEIFIRMLDGVDPKLIDSIKEATCKIPDVKDVSEVRLRWLGHWLHAEVNVAVDPTFSVSKGHEIAMTIRSCLLKQIPHLYNAIIHIDPADLSGEKHHLS